MPDDTKDLKKLWEDEIATRKEAQRWNMLSNAGFIGLVGAEMPTILAKDKGTESKWVLPLFIASSVSVIIGTMMNWIKGNKAEALRESNLLIEHSRNEPQDAAEPAQWSAKIAAQQDTPLGISK
jgi:hypothetical protein